MIHKRELLELHKEHYTISHYNNGDWATYLPDPTKPHGRRFVRKKTQAEIEEAVIEYWKGTIENPSILDVFTEWNDRRLELGKISNSTHYRNIQEFNRHYSTFGNKKVKTIMPDEIADFLEEEISRCNLSSKSFANLKSITKGFLLRAKKKKYINFNVKELFDDLDLSDSSFKKTKKPDNKEVFNEEETEKILSYLVENFDVWNAGIIFMFLTGVRVGELAALKHSDFIDDNSVQICRTEVKYKDEGGKYQYIVKETPKTEAGIRTVAIAEAYTEMSKRIQTVCPECEYLFMHNGHRITTNSFRSRLRRVCDRLGIVEKSPHKIRKTFGSILLDNHVDKQMVVSLMGHTNIATTEGYYHRDRRNQKEKVKILSMIPEFRAKAQ